MIEEVDGPLSLLIVSTTYRPAANGQAVFTTRLARGLTRRGHKVAVAIPSDRWVAYRERRDGVQLEALAAVPVGRLEGAYFTPFPLPGLRRIIDQVNPDLVHLQDHYPLARWAFRAARRRGLPVLGTNHFIPENIVHYVTPFDWAQEAMLKGLWWTMTSLYSQLDMITTPTETAADIVRRAGVMVPLRAISNGVDLDRFRPTPGLDRAEVRREYGLGQDDPLFIYVGRLDEEKDLDVALEAVRRLDQRVQLAVIGEGRYEREIHSRAGEIRLDGRVRFTGRVEGGELPGLLQAADVFVMPSPAELQSIATLEAMALGKPILAARARALPELVKEGGNGYLFTPGDPDDAARKMSRLLDERDRWPEMGQASRQLAGHHDLHKTIRAYEALYREILEARAGPFTASKPWTHHRERRDHREFH